MLGGEDTLPRGVDGARRVGTRFDDEDDPEDPDSDLELTELDGVDFVNGSGYFDTSDFPIEKSREGERDLFD